METRRHGDHKLLASFTYELSTRTTQVTGTANNTTTFFKRQSK